MPRRNRFMPLLDRIIGPRKVRPQPPGHQELPPLPHGAAHFHVCKCGGYLACVSKYDECPVGATWDCPTCERQALDDYYYKAYIEAQRV